MDGIPVVTLIVKAPNQQIEDQIIKCDLSWTIKKLKGYLSEVYPSKPKTEEQKLIYSGQLLGDSVILKDILRRYEGQETHTVHLVCAPTKDNQKSYSTTKFTVKSSSSSASVSNNSPSSSSSTSSPSSSSSSVTEPIPSTSASSMINQRLDQTNVLTKRKTPTNSETGQPSTSQTSVPMSQPSHLYQWNANRSGTESLVPPDYTKMFAEFTEKQKQMLEQGYTMDSQAYASQLAFFQQAYMNYLAQYMQLYAQQQKYLTENKIQINVGNNLPTNLPEQNRLQPMEQVPARAPPEPIQNVNVNAIDGEDGIIDRDWLDWFYVVSRLTVLLGIVYFYSSPLRFIFVFVLGCTMYLYQIGFFRGHLENNAINNNNNNNNNNRNNNIQREQPGRDGANQEQNNPPGNNHQTPPVQNIIERPTVLGVMWTFFTTFFASLIPEVPNAV